MKLKSENDKRRHIFQYAPFSSYPETTPQPLSLVAKREVVLKTSIEVSYVGNSTIHHAK